MLQSLPQRLRSEEEIGYDYDKGPLGNLLCGLVDAIDEAGLAAGVQLPELVKDNSEMKRSTLGRDLVLEPLGAAGEADGITLLGCEISESACAPAGVIEARISFLTVGHGPTGIDDEAKTEVRVCLEFLDVVAVRATPGTTVEATSVIARHIFPILGELES